MIKRFFVILACLVLVFPVLAQNLSNEEQGYMDEITIALDSTFVTESYRFSGVQILNQYIEVQGTELTQQMTQFMSGDFVNNGERQDSYMTVDQALEQVIGDTEVEVAMLMEMLVLEEGLFVQFSDISPAEIIELYPDEWLLLDASAISQYQGLSLMNPEQMTELADAQSLAAPLVDIAEVASSIENLGDEDIDGVATTGYLLTADAELLYSEENLDKAYSLFDFSSLGLDISLLEFEVGDDAMIQYTIYIGQHDGLLYRMESVVDMVLIIDASLAGITGDFIIDQQLTAEYDFFDFDADIELPTP